ncbi:MAG TPA: hypothetical protein VE616_04830 [Candidatus Udaeobacter sp.]|jgi:hypothetical protein|nr:hypothetical protein [Candidatus Udaeobacter sp.]
MLFTFVAALGVALIVVGVSLSLARDFRDRVSAIERFFDLLEERVPLDYRPFLPAAGIALGVVLVLVGFVLGFLVG